jgi:membrane protein
MINLIKNLYQAAVIWVDQDMVYYAAAFSYYAPLAIIPLILISLTLVGFFYGPEFTSQVLFGWGNIVSPELTSIVSEAVRNLKEETNSFTIPLIGVAIFSSISIVALNVISAGFQRLWKINDVGVISWIRRSIRSIIFIIVLQIYLIVIIGLQVVLNAFPIKADSIYYSILLFFSTAALFTFLYHFLYRYSPSLKNSLIGGFVGAVLFMVAKYLVYVYIISTPLLSFYGGAGLILVLLIWVYVLSAIIFYGAAVAGLYEKINKNNYLK